MTVASHSSATFTSSFSFPHFLVKWLFCMCRCWHCWEAVSTWHLAVPVLGPAVRLGPRHPSARAQFPQRPTLPPFQKDIFRSWCLASGKTSSLIGEQTNRVPLCSVSSALCFRCFHFLPCMSLSPRFTAFFLSVSPLPPSFHFTFGIAVPSSNNL